QLQKTGPVLLVVFFGLSGSLAYAQGTAANPLRFDRDVLPILTARCLKCHGLNKPKAGPDLRTRAAALKGGEAGPSVVPGSAERSLLFQMVRKGEMPPQQEKLTAEQLRLIQTWIDGGAQGTAEPEVVVRDISEADREFWAFRRPVRPPVPAVRHRAQ